MAPNEKVFFHEKLGLRSKTPGKSQVVGCKSLLFDENLMERGSMYDHFTLCGSAWGAIWGRLSKKEFSPKTVSRLCCVFALVWIVILGVS